MKRISCLVLTLLLALLCACGQTDTLPADDPPSADPSPALTTSPGLPPVLHLCRLVAHRPHRQQAPLAASASRGAPDYIPV